MLALVTAFVEFTPFAAGNFELQFLGVSLSLNS
jgi:hypothetical protein